MLIQLNVWFEPDMVLFLWFCNFHVEQFIHFFASYFTNWIQIFNMTLNSTWFCIIWFWLNTKRLPKCFRITNLMYTKWDHLAISHGSNLKLQTEGSPHKYSSIWLVTEPLSAHTITHTTCLDENVKMSQWLFCSMDR